MVLEGRLGILCIWLWCFEKVVVVVECRWKWVDLDWGLFGLGVVMGVLNGLGGIYLVKE